MTDADAEHIRAAEARRCAALLDRDAEALRAVVSPAVTHVHGTGLVQHGDEYFAHATASAYRRTDRGELTIVIDGDVAVSTGAIITVVRQTDEAPERRIEGVALQVWRRAGDGWRQSAFAFTPTPTKD
jgi:ketosteroid isomerase-like protein